MTRHCDLDPNVSYRHAVAEGKPCGRCLGVSPSTASAAAPVPPVPAFSVMTVAKIAVDVDDNVEGEEEELSVDELRDLAETAVWDSRCTAAVVEGETDDGAWTYIVLACQPTTDCDDCGQGFPTYTAEDSAWIYRGGARRD